MFTDVQEFFVKMRILGKNFLQKVFPQTPFQKLLNKWID